MVEVLRNGNTTTEDTVIIFGLSIVVLFINYRFRVPGIEEFVATVIKK